MNLLKEEIIKHIDENNKNIEIIYLNNLDFKTGTYIINKPGKYILTEDIIFNPNYNELINNEDLFMFPTKIQKKNKYNNPAFHLGFFSAILINSSNVIIDMNGHSISQGKLHYLVQRFFSIINLNSSMFIQNQGPNNGSLSNEIKDIDNKYIYIHNGKFGLSSHYGIMGNNNSHIIIENCEFSNFEVGGISLNNCDNSIFENIYIHDNYINIPIQSNYSVLINTLLTFRDYNNDILNHIYIENNTLNIKDCIKHLEKLNIRIISNYLKNEYKSINNNSTNKDIYDNEIEKYYYNKSGLSDGSTIVGIQITPKGVAIFDFEKNPCKELIKNTKDTKNINNCMNITLDKYCHNLFFNNIKIYNLITSTKETITIKYQNNNLSGCFGDGIILDNLINKEGYYQPNILYRTIFCLSKIIKYKDHKLITSNFIPDFIINWCDKIENIKFEDLEEYKDIQLTYGKDIMGHLNKGCIGLRLGGINNISLSNIEILNIVNYGKNSIGDIDYKGNYSYGITLSYCRNIQYINKLFINDIYSYFGNQYCLLIQE